MEEEEEEGTHCFSFPSSASGNEATHEAALFPDVPFSILWFVLTLYLNFSSCAKFFLKRGLTCKGTSGTIGPTSTVKEAILIQ